MTEIPEGAEIGFFGLRKTLSASERSIALKAFAEALDNGSHSTAASAGRWGNLVVEAYDALLLRARLAEMALHRTKLNLADANALASKPKPETRAHEALFKQVVRDYVDPLLPFVRDGIEYTGPGGGWYLPLEDVRAKLIGAERTARRVRVGPHPEDQV